MVQRPLKAAVFLDRDGVVNRDSPLYIKSWAEFEFLPGSLEGIRRLTAAEFPIFLITNQSGVNRGLIPPAALKEIHTRMRAAVENYGGHITGIFFCPHTPEEVCGCRKPAPGLILEAQKRRPLDLAKSFMVGDKTTDLECGRRAGCGHTVLIQSAESRSAAEMTAQQDPVADFIAPDLLVAAEWIIQISKR